MPKVLKLGTRRSLLAWAQSGWVASEVERLNPGLRVEMVGIETRGDQIQDVPLQAIDGKEFFVAELDHALRSGAVDLTVHSMKDLSLERPEEFVCAAVPRRENPRDVALFGPGAFERIRAGKTLRIGTSSPRRIENIPSFLEKAIPAGHGGLEFVSIRGNVNTRLARVLEAVDHPKYLDGVILAFAGLIRLWADNKAREEARKLLERARWMVLPLKQCPAASAQGALAVECRATDSATREAIGKLHDPATSKHAAAERALLALWGGGCHQRFGATSISHPELGDMMYVRGRKPSDEAIDYLEWQSAAEAPSNPVAWDGSLWRSKEFREAASGPSAELQGRAIFVAHSRAVTRGLEKELAGSRVWTSGVPSWFALAAQGVWVEGCAENLGFEMLKPTLQEGVLQLPALSEWAVLTHEDARTEWHGAVKDVIATYSVEPAGESSVREASKAAASSTHFWWSSGSQFDLFRSAVPAGAHHSCGAGKTAKHLRENGFQPTVFPSVEEWKKWLKT